MTSTLERARGRWREILPQLGIDTRYLTNKKGPCPICCPNSPNAKCFRFDDKNGEGRAYCNHCGPSGGYLLVKKINRFTSSKETFDAIDRVIGTNTQTNLTEVKKINPSYRLREIERLLLDADSPLIVDKYLSSRGIFETSNILRGHSCCSYFDEDGKFVGEFPAIIAPIMAPDDTLQSAQRIYVADVFPRKKTMPPVNTINGGAVRLHQRAKEMGVAEGVETALAAGEIYNIPVWAAISAHGIETFVPPLCVRRLHIFGDNDKSFTGQKAAYVLANRLRRELPEIDIRVHIPEKEDTDFNDVLRERRHV